jgi:DNA-binding response OmpR family regulator
VLPRQQGSKGDPAVEKVLVIDDEFDVLLLCRVNLSHAGLQVQEAKSGKAGLESALEDTPDAVVLDLMMPEMDGFEVLKRLREDERTRAIPVVILSARTGEADRARCVALGANDYLTKPFFPDELLDRLDGLISANR